MYDGNLRELIDKHVDSKILEVTFNEKVSRNDLAKLGKIKEKTLKRVVLEVPKEKSKQVAVELLNNYPVDDILINEIEIEEVIRRVFKR